MMTLEAKVEALRKDFDDYKDKKAAEESRRLRAALIWSGGFILASMGFMWSEIIWPAIKMLKSGQP